MLLLSFEALELDCLLIFAAITTVLALSFVSLAASGRIRVDSGEQVIHLVSQVLLVSHVVQEVVLVLWNSPATFCGLRGCN